jgi:hypothetical protein
VLWARYWEHDDGFLPAVYTADGAAKLTVEEAEEAGGYLQAPHAR